MNDIPIESHPQPLIESHPESPEWGIADYPEPPADTTDIPEGTTYISISTGSFPNFAAAVKARCYNHLSDLGLDEDYLSTLADQFALRFDKIFQKYRAGQLEHGGDIRDRDLGRERSQEIDDLIVYDIIETTLRPPSIPVRI